jgi:hypothetical protein
MPRRLFLRLAAPILFAAASAVTARAAPLAPALIYTPPAPLYPAAQAALCRAAIASAESQTRIPDEFLSAIGRVESGRPISGIGLAPWPWTINAAGTGHFYASKAEAIAAAQTFLAAGVKSIDVGCLQVNLMYHPDAFASLDAAFDPATNAAYAARLLLSLFAQQGSWPRAAAAYHSQTPALGNDYQQKVLAEWAMPEGAARGDAALRPGPTKLVVPTPVDGASGPVTFFGHTMKLPGGAAQAGAQLPQGGRSLAAYRAYPVRMAGTITLRRPLALK